MSDALRASALATDLYRMSQAVSDARAEIRRLEALTAELRAENERLQALLDTLEQRRLAA